MAGTEGFPVAVDGWDRDPWKGMVKLHPDAAAAYDTAARLLDKILAAAADQGAADLAAGLLVFSQPVTVVLTTEEVEIVRARRADNYGRRT